MLFDEVSQNLSKSEGWALDNFGHFDVKPFEILPVTHPIEEGIQCQLNSLHHFFRRDNCVPNGTDKEYELTGSILEKLLVNANSNFKKFDRSSAEKRSTKMELFRRVNIGLEYIHSHSLQQLNLDGIARSCGLSKFHFIRVFREFYGMTPSDYISHLRLRRAQLLLASSNRSLQSIASDLGFSELSAFNRFFKRMTGISPSVVRSGN